MMNSALRSAKNNRSIEETSSIDIMLVIDRPDPVSDNRIELHQRPLAYAMRLA